MTRGTIIGGVVLALILFFSITPMGKATWNLWFYDVQKADDATRYETRQKVESTARSMIASYTADKLIYEQYKDSDKNEEQSIANQAKIRANRTAANYNEHIKKNSYIWRDNIPGDIKTPLDYIK